MTATEIRLHGNLVNTYRTSEYPDTEKCADVELYDIRDGSICQTWEIVTWGSNAKKHLAGEVETICIEDFDLDDLP